MNVVPVEAAGKDPALWFVALVDFDDRQQLRAEVCRTAVAGSPERALYIGLVVRIPVVRLRCTTPLSTVVLPDFYRVSPASLVRCLECFVSATRLLTPVAGSGFVSTDLTQDRLSLLAALDQELDRARLGIRLMSVP